jgi:hypothetical protein
VPSPVEIDTANMEPMLPILNDFVFARVGSFWYHFFAKGTYAGCRFSTMVTAARAMGWWANFIPRAIGDDAPGSMRLGAVELLIDFALVGGGVWHRAVISPGPKPHLLEHCFMRRRDSELRSSLHG